MAHVRNDFTVKENKQTQRSQKNLWDVICGGNILVTTHGKEKAQIIANDLNKNPYHFDFLTYQNKSTGRNR